MTILKERALDTRKVLVKSGTTFGGLKASKEMTKSNEDLAIFGFEEAFDTESTQENVYSLVQPAVDAVVRKGVNACVFAYGQTGSGKTYTMYGKNDLENMGMAQRAIIDIFENLSTAPASSEDVFAEADEIVSDSESQISELEMSTTTLNTNQTVNDIEVNNTDEDQTQME